VKDFSKLLAKLRDVLAKHPEIHFSLSKNPNEIDLREAHYVLKDFVSSQVITDELITGWLDEYAFFNLGAGKSFDV
jgi:hypothetical protein